MTMASNQKFIQLMWKLTVIPFGMAFALSAFVVLYHLIIYVFGDTEALKGDVYNFCVFFVIISIPLYLFLRINKKIVTTFTSRDP